MEVCLFEPEIAQNAGSIARLCSCFGVILNIIEPTSFIIDDKKFKRAGMDYIEKVNIKLHSSFLDFKKGYEGRLILFDTKSSTGYCHIKYKSNDCLIFGKESTGVPDYIYDLCDENVVIPMKTGVRSINLSMSVAIGLSEAIRQSFP